jgi:hypothetical protein
MAPRPRDVVVVGASVPAADIGDVLAKITAEQAALSHRMAGFARERGSQRIARESHEAAEVPRQQVTGHGQV